MTLLYRSKWTFTDSLYCKSVRGLAFSPDGSYLAYGSGENLCILNAIDKRLVYIVRGRNTPKGVSTVTALTWLPHDAFHLLCTFSDGLIATVTRLANQLHVGGIESMVPSVTHIAVNTSGTRLATGGDSGISIWFKASTGTWRLVKQLGPPQRFQDNAYMPIEVTGMHWLESKTDQLIVVYKAHGVQLWNISAGTVIASILTTSNPIGSSSLSPDYKTLVLAMQRGYDVHHLETHVPLVSIPHELHAPGPVIFLHGGLALLGASRRGEVSLWGSSDGEKLQDMKQNSSDNWQSLAAYDDKFLIATATSKKIILWEAVEEEKKEDSAPSVAGGQLGGNWWVVIALSTVIALLLNLLLELKSKL
ncbi:hypothetical protein QCA50_018578 [Cerrena zonata]|uniref:WD40 repeat-like protein n=1 Tax=Cerrena zonata TaxID=2478898 RepID=A0AAW0FEF0_9APHY